MSALSLYNERLDQNLAQIYKIFESLNGEQLNWKFNAEKWSIGQCIDHLITTNTTYFPILDALAKGTYKVSFAAKIPFWAGFVGYMLKKSVSPDNMRPIKTFPVFAPSQSQIPDNIIALLSENHDILKEKLQKIAQLNFDKTKIGSPVNNANMIYSLSDALEIIVLHEQRHTVQAQNVWTQYKNR